MMQCMAHYNEGLLLLDSTMSGRPHLPLPPDIYALFTVARDETNAAAADEVEAAAATFEDQRDQQNVVSITAAAALDVDAAATSSVLTAASFAEGLRGLVGRTSAEAALDYTGSFRRREPKPVPGGAAGKNVGVATSQMVETPQREWDQRVDRALRTTRRGLWLANNYAAAAVTAGGASGNSVHGAADVASSSFDGLTLLVTATTTTAANTDLLPVAASTAATFNEQEDPELMARCPRLQCALRPTWGDPLAPAHAADLAALIADVLMPKSSSSSSSSRGNKD